MSKHVSWVQNCALPRAPADLRLICMTEFGVMNFILSVSQLAELSVGPTGFSFSLFTVSLQMNCLIQPQLPPDSPRALWEILHMGLFFLYLFIAISITHTHTHTCTATSFSIFILSQTPGSPLFRSLGSDFGSHYESEEIHFRASEKGWLS